MVDKIKDFAIVKFCRSKYMNKKRKQFLKIIVNYEISFYPISFLNRPLLILEHFKEETIQTVISEDLGYNLLVYESIPNPGISGLIHGNSSIIILSEKSSS